MIMPLPLRDVHPGTAPSWWPPAPGWWILAVLVLAIVAVLAAWRLRKRRRRIVIARSFDEAVDRTHSPAEQVAAMSELLRRAARRRDPVADRLQGEAWLGFLDDGLPARPFSTGAGTLLLDGGFRPDVAPDDALALRVLARQRYLSWMQGA